MIEQSRLVRVPAASAVALGILGTTVLVGWIAGIEVLKSGVPGLVAMKANTAACLLLSAGSLWWLRGEVAMPRQSRLGLAAAVACSLIGGLSLVEYVAGVSLGIDQLLFKEHAGAVATSNPGRMAPNTAVAFVLCGASLMLSRGNGRRRAWLASGSALLAAVLAAVALIGYLCGVTSLYEVSDLTQMAVPTAVGFLVLAGGLLCLRPGAGPLRLLFSDTMGGRVIRVLFPAALGVPIVLAVLRLAGQSAGLYQTDTGTWLFALAIIVLLVPLTWTLALSLERAELQYRRARAARRDVQRERAAFERSPIGAALVSVDGRYERVNAALATMLGGRPGDLEGLRMADLTHPEDRAGSLEALATLVAGTLTHHQLDKRYLHRDGGVVHARVWLTTIHAEDGTVSQLYAQMQDLTASRRAACQLEEAQFETLARLASAAEFRDDETGEHTRRVGDVAGRIAEHLGRPAAEVRLIRLAAPLHDVGKIGTPDAILFKPGRLTTEEFDEIKRHTTIGARMLEGGAFPLLRMAEQIALTHHERWDGTGYPGGLAGEDIPLVGRIVAVADVFDALTHDRPYKRAWTEDEAIAEIRNQAGRHFDPDVVAAFLATIETPARRSPDRRELVRSS